GPAERRRHDLGPGRGPRRHAVDRQQPRHRALRRGPGRGAGAPRSDTRGARHPRRGHAAVGPRRQPVGGRQGRAEPAAPGRRGRDRLRQAGEGVVLSGKEEGTPNSLSHDWVVSLLEDPAGGLWVGTYGGGLNRLDPNGRFTAYKEAQGLPSDVVYGIQRDGSG